MGTATTGGGIVTIKEQIAALDAALEGFPAEYAFVGGGVLALLVTDPTAGAVRVTKDVDVLASARTRREYLRLDGELERRGFRHDTAEGAPMCRWKWRDATVDVLPIEKSVLGWESRWFAEALAAAVPVSAGSRMVRTVTAPYFVALKLEAFDGRGEGDYLTSHDFEDVICLFDGRPETVGEIMAAPEELRKALADHIRRDLAADDFETAVDGFVHPEPFAEERKARILGRFRAVAKQSEDRSKR